MAIKPTTVKGDLLVENDLTLKNNKNQKALVSDSTGKVTESTTTATEVGYLSGVTSNVQTQLNSKQNTSEKGQPNGYASLDGTGKVPAAQLPSYVDDVVEYPNFAALPVTGETSKLYITLNDNKVYRWSGSTYIEVSSNADLNSIASIQHFHYFEDNSSVFTTETAGIQDTTSLIRDGWYFKNIAANKKINWQFWNNEDNITLGQLNAYSVVTFDQVANPKFSIKTGSGTPPPPLPASTRLLYSFNNNFLDSSGSGFHLTPANQMPLFDTGKFGQGLVAYDVNSNLTYPQSLVCIPPALDGLGSGDFTLEFFITLKSGANQGIFSWGDSRLSGTPYFNAYLVYYPGVDTLLFRTGDSGGSITLSHNGITSLKDDNIFHHIAYVRTSSNNKLSLYIDGIKVNEAIWVNPVSFADNFPICVGGIFPTESPEWACNSIIDEFRFSFDSIYTVNFTPPTAPFLGTTASSTVVYDTLASSPVLGKKYLIYAGTEPLAHPELPRIAMVKSNTLSLGTQDPSEIVTKATYYTDTATINTVEFITESLGVWSANVKKEYDLRIRHEILANKTTDGTLSANSDTLYPTEKAVKTYVDSKISGDILTQDELMKEPTGFAVRSTSTISFNDTSRTFTITPVGASFDVYVKGHKITKSSAESITIPNNSGDHYIYYTMTGVLSSTQVIDSTLFTDNAMISIVYWNTDTLSHTYFAEERHGLQMDGATHAYLHTILGARFVSGLALQGFTIGNGSSNAHAYFSADQGSIRDEDLLHQIPAQNTIPILFRQGQLWRKKSADGFPLIYSGTAGYIGANQRPAYNQYIGGAWQLTEMPNTNFILVHFFGTNDLENPVVGVAGTQHYNNLPAARTGANSEISALSGLPFAEFVPIGSVIFQSNNYSNTPKARVVQTDTGANYVDFRGTQTYTPSGQASDHGLLSGLVDDDHIQYHNDTRGDARYYTKTQIDAMPKGTSFSSTQVSHGFSVLSPIYHDGTIWKLAKADSDLTFATHVVIEVADADNFKATNFGRISVPSHGLTIGEYYCVSDTTAGLLVDTIPSNGIYNSVLYVEDAIKIHIMVHRAVSTIPVSTFADSEFVIYDAADENKQMLFNPGGTTNTATMIVANQTVNRTITLPDASTTMVGTDVTQTLTNKSIVSPDRLDVKKGTNAQLLTYAALPTTTNGQLVFDTTNKQYLAIVDNTLVPLGSGGSLSFEATQVSHGFSILSPIYYDGTIWKLAKADAGQTLATHIVMSVKDADNFTATNFGKVTATAHGLTIGEFYYVSEVTAGLLVATQPTTGYSNPVLFVETANTVHALVYRPSAVATEITDSNFTIKDSANSSKQLQFDVTGTAATKTTLKTVQTANRTVTLPDATTTLVGTDVAQVLSNKSFSNNVGIGTATPDTNAILDLTSTSKAFLPPRMTTAQKNAITSPSTGMLVYDTTLSSLSYYNGSAWLDSMSVNPASTISALDINWYLSNLFTKSISANSTFTFSNNADGRTIVVRLINTSGGNLTLSWPASVINPVTTLTTAKTGIYTFIQFGTTVYMSSLEV